ncbi:MAG: hypothetical protein HUU20_10565 [Pirellulales bacterium]|nr:hypothetical protein [Pirellulales bacterium]
MCPRRGARGAGRGARGAGREAWGEPLGNGVWWLASVAALRTSANTAYLNGCHFAVPGDRVALKSEDDTAIALRQRRRVLNAEVRPSENLISR